MSDLRLSHVLCRVDDLHEALAAATGRGFACVYGSEPETAHNALIWFETGPFLELFVMPTMDAAALAGLEGSVGAETAARMRRWQEPGQGWRDVAAETDSPDLDAVSARLAREGLAIGPVRRYERTPPGADTVSWWLTGPHDPTLPFFMSAYSTPQRPTAISHANGAKAVVRVTVADAGPAEYEQRLGRLLGSDEARSGWRVVAGSAFAVQSVEIAGLDAGFDLCGARIEAAPAG